LKDVPKIFNYLFKKAIISNISMKRLKENFQKAHIVIIGSGIIGKFNALELSELGFK